MNPALEQIAASAVDRALKGGATDAECTLIQGDQFTATVRRGEVDNLKQAGSSGAGIRVLIGKRGASAYTSDLSVDGIQAMVDGALHIANITTDDPYAGLPETAEFGRLANDLQLYSPDVDALPTEEKIRMAREAEAVTLAADPRISNTEGASFDSYTGYRVFANSRGFVNSYRLSNCSLATAPVAKSGESMERDYWMSAARSVTKLESPETVGRKAVERVLRRLGARKVTTQRVPVIFEARVARSLLDHVFEAVNGSAVYRGASFLAGKLGEKIASERVTIVDDTTIPGLFGTMPCDDEGVPSRRTVVVDRGVLSSYLLNVYSARRLNMKTTGNASRGLTGAAAVGHGNFYLEAGTKTPAELIKEIETGLYVTELIGFGANTVTGDYSRGAVGLWIENGELSYPVSEITVSGTIPEILQGIEAVASDLEFRGSLASPAVMVREMMVSGK